MTQRDLLGAVSVLYLRCKSKLREEQRPLVWHVAKPSSPKSLAAITQDSLTDVHLVRKRDSRYGISYTVNPATKNLLALKFETGSYFLKSMKNFCDWNTLSYIVFFFPLETKNLS